MNKNLKNKITLGLGLLTIVFLIFSIVSCQDAANQRKLVDQEKQMRIELEKKASELARLNKDLEQKMNQLQETLNQEISKLKGELEKTTGLKEKLEESLQKTLVPQGEELDSSPE